MLSNKKFIKKMRPCNSCVIDVTRPPYKKIGFFIYIFIWETVISFHCAFFLINFVGVSYLAGNEEIENMIIGGLRRANKTRCLKYTLGVSALYRSDLCHWRTGAFCPQLVSIINGLSRNICALTISYCI